MQEDIENKTVRFAVNATKVTAKILYESLITYRENVKNHILKKIAGDEPKTGKQSVKELIGQGQGVTSIPITDGSLCDFKKIANKYGVDFAIVKDKSENPSKFTIFFKAKDVDAITQVMKEYSNKLVKREKKPSILQKLKKLKAIVAQQPRKVKEKRKEQSL